jgi:hypothetical protein
LVAQGDQVAERRHIALHFDVLDEPIGCMILRPALFGWRRLSEKAFIITSRRKATVFAHVRLAERKTMNAPLISNSVTSELGHEESYGFAP